MTTRRRRIDMSVTTYKSAECAAFMRSREKYGHLSNMTPHYPLQVNGLRFQGPEGLYQAFKYPEEPAFQERIAKANSGMAANKLTYQNPNVPARLGRDQGVRHDLHGGREAGAASHLDRRAGEDQAAADRADIIQERPVGERGRTGPRRP